jgi:hypothetical protein
MTNWSAALTSAVVAGGWTERLRLSAFFIPLGGPQAHHTTPVWMIILFGRWECWCPNKIVIPTGA